jgi:hypothetical protein
MSAVKILGMKNVLLVESEDKEMVTLALGGREEDWSTLDESQLVIEALEGGETFFMNVMLRGIGEDDNGSEEVECLTVEEEEG